MLISPDTSAVHTAAAFKIPVLALYPKSDWNFASWRPYKTLNRAVHSASENVNSISIDEVFNNFVELNNEIIENGKSGI
jgi:ADP-heptose:LPS heptosyltransferase